MRKKNQKQMPLISTGIEHPRAIELDVISKILDANPNINEMVLQDLTHGVENRDSGAEGMSAEQVLRAAIIKQTEEFSYEDLAFHLVDSRCYRKFCRIGITQKGFQKSALNSNIKAISPQTWEAINQIIVTYGEDKEIEKGREARIDCTVVSSNIHKPTDSSLLWDSVRVLTRMLGQINERFDEVNKSVGQIIADEVHICPAETYYHTMSSLTAKYKFGFSATPKREDGLTKVIHYASGPKIHTVDQKYLKDVLIKPDVRYIKTNYNFPLISSEEYQELLNDLSSDKERNKLILDTLLEDYNDKHIIILCVRVAQVKYLKESLGDRAAMLHSGMRKKERLEVMEALQSGKTKIVISTYGLFSTGIDIPQLEVLLLAAPIKSEIKLRQASGRLMRMSQGKKTATIVDFVDNKVDLLRYQGYHRKRIFKKLEQDL